jgi:hypothetical protein
MSRKGYCLEHFEKFKVEYIYQRKYLNQKESKIDGFQYIEGRHNAESDYRA